MASAFLTYRARVLLWLAGHPTDSLKATGAGVGITERQVARIVTELREDGVLVATPARRHTLTYRVNYNAPITEVSGTTTFTVSDLIEGFGQKE